MYSTDTRWIQKQLEEKKQTFPKNPLHPSRVPDQLFLEEKKWFYIFLFTVIHGFKAVRDPRLSQA